MNEPASGRTGKLVLHQGQWHYYHRYSLCWAPYDLYEPKTAEQLAVLRANRERNKQEREEKKWQEDNPLLAWAERESE